MSKKGANICIVLTAVFFIFLMGCTLAVQIFGKETTYTIPKSGLGYSVFDQQNMRYYPSEDLTYVMQLEKNDYKVDIYDSPVAKVDKYNFIDLTSGVVMGIGEDNKDSYKENVIKDAEQILLGDIDGVTAVQSVLADEGGYMNGSGVEYSVIKNDYYYGEQAPENTSTQEPAGSMCVIIYKIDVPDGKMPVIIVTATSDVTSEMLQAMKNAMDSVYYTLRPSDAVIDTDAVDEDTDNSDGYAITKRKDIISKEVDQETADYYYDELSTEEETETETEGQE